MKKSQDPSKRIMPIKPSWLFKQARLQKHCSNNENTEQIKDSLPAESQPFYCRVLLIIGRWKCPYFNSGCFFIIGGHYVDDKWLLMKRWGDVDATTRCPARTWWFYLNKAQLNPSTCKQVQFLNVFNPWLKHGHTMTHTHTLDCSKPWRNLSVKEASSAKGPNHPEASSSKSCSVPKGVHCQKASSSKES